MNELTQEKSDEVFKLYPTLYLDDTMWGDWPNTYYKTCVVFYDRYTDEDSLVDNASYCFDNELVNRVGGVRLFRTPSSHTTVRAVRHTAVR